MGDLGREGFQEGDALFEVSGFLQAGADAVVCELNAVVFLTEMGQKYLAGLIHAVFR